MELDYHFYNYQHLINDSKIRSRNVLYLLNNYYILIIMSELTRKKMTEIVNTWRESEQVFIYYILFYLPCIVSNTVV